MGETLPGWEAPVFSGMAEPPQYKGVPLMFFAGNLLGTLFLALCLVQVEPVYSVMVVALGALLYGVVVIGTKIESRWAGILFDYLQYANLYEA